MNPKYHFNKNDMIFEYSTSAVVCVLQVLKFNYLNNKIFVIKNFRLRTYTLI